jgi:hypothetical protein
MSWKELLFEHKSLPAYETANMDMLVDWEFVQGMFGLGVIGAIVMWYVLFLAIYIWVLRID